MSHNLCQPLPHVFADNRQLLHSRNPWVCCTLGSAGGMIWWGDSQIWLLLLLLALPACLLPWSCSHINPHVWHQFPSPGRRPSAFALQQGCLPPSLPQPGPNPSQHQPSARSPQIQQRSTSGSTSRLWCTTLQGPCQHRKTMSKSCCHLWFSRQTWTSFHWASVFREFRF